MVSADRQTIMEANRSLRNIKNELENLLERGVIDETVYDNIHSALPEESPLSGPLRTATSSNATPIRTPNPTSGPTSPPTQAFANLDVNKSKSPAPPSYEDTPPPNLPTRKTGKPVIAQARALYRYEASDARDVSFEKDDKISVHEYMNEDWWMGQNDRTGREGIFPRNYVLVEHQEKAPVPQYGYPAQQQQQQAGGPPQQQNPYDSNVPPMAVAEGDKTEEPSKAQQYGKKFGKKMGNAAIFGAGATIGSNIVNSIF
ncbi:protein that induces appearance of [PIN+] prion when overproduced [Amphichorda felina]